MMENVSVKFERESLDGLVAVGTYLIDVFGRFGVGFVQQCEPTRGIHFCETVISTGMDILSPVTAAEKEHFAASGRSSNQRLACEARIMKPGEIVIMTTKRDVPHADAPAKETIQDEFNALPLEKKISNLLKMEVVTLGETFSYVMNSPFKVVEKVGEVMAEFGMKIENEAKNASRPKDADANPSATPQPEAKAKARRKSAPSREAKS